MALATSKLYPADSSLADGRLHIGGCDAVALAREHGTPAYVVAEDDLRSRAREFAAALAEHHDGPGDVVFASKAFPATAVLRVFAEEGLGCDVGAGVGTVVVDHPAEAERLEALVPDGRRQRVLLRVTPGVDADTHEAILTGQAGSKFGMPPAEARELAARPWARLEVAGLHMHIGSQIAELAPFR